MISLWILVILVIFAVSLGYRASINLKLARYQRDRLKAYYTAKAGINKAITTLREDANNSETKDYDSLDETWSTGKNKDKNIFENIEITEGSDEEFTVHVTDEERNININSLNTQLLQQLFIFKGLEVDASGLTETITEWINAEKETDEVKAIFKNEPLKRAEELLLILKYFYQKKEKAKEVYNAIKDLITVYGDAKININTTSLNTLIILANSIAENDAQKNCVAKITSAIIELRNIKGHFTKKEDVNIILTPDDEMNLFNNLTDKVVFKSDIFKIEATALVINLTKNITAIYDRRTNKIVYWHEN